MGLLHFVFDDTSINGELFYAEVKKKARCTWRPDSRSAAVMYVLVGGAVGGTQNRHEEAAALQKRGSGCFPPHINAIVEFA